MHIDLGPAVLSTSLRTHFNRDLAEALQEQISVRIGAAITLSMTSLSFNSELGLLLRGRRNEQN